MNLRTALFRLGSILFVGTFVGTVIGAPARAEEVGLAGERAEGAAPASGRADDVTGALGRLSSASASDRSLAQRWLAAHLGPGDLAAVSGAVRAGDAEVRARVVEALSGEDRLLALAASLATSSDPVPAAVGRTALVESAERWSAGAKKPGLVQTAAFTALREQHDRTIVLDSVLANAPLETIFDALARAGVDDVSIVVDPRCASTVGNAHALEGRLDSVLSDLLAARGLACRGFGLGEEEPDGAQRWIAVVPRDSDARANTAANLVSSWCIAVASGGDSAARARAARALAASGWPAAIAWLADLWFAHDDDAALEGTLLAARRGRVSPVLLQPDAQTRLRTLIDRALAAGNDRNASRVDVVSVAMALGMTGARGPGGEDLIAPALEGLARLEGRALYLCLVELEQRAPAGPDAVRALSAVLARVQLEPASQWLALGMLTRAAAPIAGISRPELLIAWCEERGRLDELGRILRGLPAFPPDEWRRPEDLPRAFSPHARAWIAASWLARGELDAAVDHVIASIGDEAAREEFSAGLVVASKSLGIGPLVRLFDRAIARAPDDPAPLLRTSALSGAALTKDLTTRVLALVPDPAVQREDLLVLGALSGGPYGADARKRLTAALRGAIAPDDALVAVDRAVIELRAAGDESVERAFVRAARAEARAGSTQVRARLRLDAWPTPPAGAPLRLSDQDRSFERAGQF